MFSLKIFGKNPSGERLQRIKNSANFKNGQFQNLSETKMLADGSSFLKVTLQFMNKPKGHTPSRMIPSVKSDLENLPNEKCSVVWFGHSSYLLRIGNKNVLVDPVLSGKASPVPFMIRAFEGADIYSVSDLPTVDVLLITHDHYDHLDYHVILKIKDTVKEVICSLGVASHLEYWGVDKKKITELNWQESLSTQGLNFTALPARHFSGRGTKRAKTLWSSFIIESSQHKIFAGGDSGYDTHFEEIGSKHGPFDLALLEAGQYNVSWPEIHMMPEETVQAAIDLRSKVLMPVHWAKFSLALHNWKEPAERVHRKAQELKMPVATPMIGEIFVLGDQLPQKTWWEF